jgi:hypothetical protein
MSAARASQQLVPTRLDLQVQCSADRLYRWPLDALTPAARAEGQVHGVNRLESDRWQGLTDRYPDGVR